jgi:hypothetical protein
MPRFTGSKKVTFYAIALVLFCVSLCWKPFLVIAWTITHDQAGFVGGRTISIPFPWVLTRSSNPMKARSFVSLWPYSGDENVSVLIVETPPDQQARTDADWLSDRASRFAANSFQEARNSSYRDGKVICSESRMEKQFVAYCRADSKMNLIYSGPQIRIEDAVGLLPVK